MIDYKDMDLEDKVSYLEDRLEDVNKANQSLTDTMITLAKELGFISLKLDLRAREQIEVASRTKNETN